MSRVRACIILFILPFLSCRAGMGFSGAASGIAPLSPSFVEYASGISRRAEGDGYLPSPVDLSHLRGADYSAYQAGRRGITDLPASYDLREGGLVTPVRDQGDLDSCWAFSALAAMESSHLKRTGLETNLSEMYLFWYSFNSHPGHDRTGTGGRPGGGWDNTAVSSMARWVGPVLEGEAPYGTDPAGPYERYSAPFRLSDAFFLNLQFADGEPQPTDDVRKRLIMDYGGISAGCYIGSRGVYFNERNNAWHYTGNMSPNHAVLIVGWDDSYPRENFNAFPRRNGAWLAKNSWGTGFGNRGYYWISYEDSSLRDGVVFLEEDAGTYDNNYGYDDLGWCRSVGFDRVDEGWMANVFAAAAPNESLEAVSFYTTAPNAEYELRIYTNVPIGGSPISGQLSHSASGNEVFAGYHTVRLSRPVVLGGNGRFSVVLRMRTPGYSYPLAMEMPVRYFSSEAASNRGESYLSGNGVRWYDAVDTAPERWDTTEANACIRAFTSSDVKSADIRVAPVDAPEWRYEITSLGSGVRVKVYAGLLTGIVPSDLYVETMGLSSVKWRIEDSAGREMSPGAQVGTSEANLVIEGVATSPETALRARIGFISLKLGGLHVAQSLGAPIAIGDMPGEINIGGGEASGGGGCDASGGALAAALILIMARVQTYARRGTSRA
ncbi:MAG: lectin like domain-containing protein [Synergistaceae bacterium]|nr:lectin like domain-containing protein [Synergistaceae bacterium]